MHPTKTDMNIAKLYGTVYKFANDLESLLAQQARAIPRIAREGIDEVESLNKKATAVSNKMLATINKVKAVVASTKLLQEKFNFGMAEAEGKTFIKPEDITIDTNMGEYSNWKSLCAKVGLKEAMKRLYDLKVTINGDIADYQLNRCFGYTGGEANFVEFWRFYGLETRTVLPSTNHYTWSDCERFLKTYYRVYYVRQAKGEVKVNARKRIVVDGSGKRI